MTTKITKKDFKQMLKECLVELIQEGAFVPPQPMIGNWAQQPQQPMMMGNWTQQPQPRVNLESAANNIANQFVQSMQGLDPARAEMMKNILRDTAINTLPAQANTTAEQFNGQEILNETRDQIHNEINNSELNKLGDASKWAKIAFSASRKKLPGQRGNDEEDYG